MCLLLLLFLLARRAPIAAFYSIQALTCLGLSLAALLVDRPVLVAALEATAAVMYGAIAAAHMGPFHERLRNGRPPPPT